jgi:hypothetical protein
MVPMKSDPNKQLKSLTVIPLSGAHYISKKFYEYTCGEEPVEARLESTRRYPDCKLLPNSEPESKSRRTNHRNHQQPKFESGKVEN